MANRYWVGGTDNWDATNGSKWSTTSGGGGGSAVPTSADDVFFDANSGAVTVTISATGTAKSVNFTGFTGSLTSSGGSQTIIVYAGLTFGSGMTLSSAGSVRFQFNSNVAGTITSNGKSFPGSILINADVGIGVSLSDAANLGPLNHFKGVFNTNNFSLTCAVISSNNAGSTRVMNLGSSTITITSTGTSFANGSSGTTTVNAGTSNMHFTSSGTHTVDFAGKTFYDVSFEKPAGHSITISGSSTFNIMNVAANCTAIFTAGTTQTVSSFTSGGTAGNLAIIQSSSAGSAFTLSDSSGTNAVSYMSIKDSTASGGATWNADDGTNTNVSGNTGWNFPIAINTGNFIPFF